MFRVEGADEVADYLSELGSDVPDEVVQETQRTVKQVESTAKQIGSSIWHKRPQVSVPRMRSVETDSGGFVEVEARGAFFQEVGTSFHPPKPAMAPALDAHLPEFYRRVERAVDKK